MSGDCSLPNANLTVIFVVVPAASVFSSNHEALYCSCLWLQGRPTHGSGHGPSPSILPLWPCDARGLWSPMAVVVAAVQRVEGGEG